MTDLIDRARKFLPEELTDQDAVFDALLDVLEAAEKSPADLHLDGRYRKHWKPPQADRGQLTRWLTLTN